MKTRPYRIHQCPMNTRQKGLYLQQIHKNPIVVICCIHEIYAEFTD